MNENDIFNTFRGILGEGRGRVMTPAERLKMIKRRNKLKGVPEPSPEEQARRREEMLSHPTARNALRKLRDALKRDKEEPPKDDTEKPKEKGKAG